MLTVIKYLEKHRETGYRQIAEAIEETTRAIRYDVDKINDELSLQKFPLIEKLPKGKLKVPENLDLSIFLEDNEFVFSSKERIKILRLIILFDTANLNIRKLSEILQVSRRSIQNDIEEIQKELEEDDIYLEYKNGFYLIEKSDKSYEIRSREIRSHVKTLYKTRLTTTYEAYIKNLIYKIFLPVDLNELFLWIDGLLKKTGWIFSDQSFKWYVANICTFTWYMIKDKKLPEKEWGKTGEIGDSLKDYEKCIGKILDHKQSEILAGFEKYTNKYVHLEVTDNLMNIEDLAEMLISKMQESLRIEFDQDGILIKGLLNHLGPMIDRIKGNVQLHDDVSQFIPDKYQYVYVALKEILVKDTLLCHLTENEEIYLAIYFIGSLRRMQKNSYMNVLLICGYGYGTTAVVKDALLNSYQVFVKKSISAYQVKHFAEWADIDVVISTVDVELPVDKPFAKVNVIFNNDDYIKLDLLGLQKRNVLTNYFAIERRLDFLNDEDKQRVMAVIKEELGYKEVRMPTKFKTLSDLLTENDIQCIKKIDDWRDAVRQSTQILKRHGNDGEIYCKNVIEGIEVRGFYSVTDQVFALLHGSENAGIQISCMSLLISEEPVRFGEKEVNLIFCLASRDKKEHIPVVTRLMRMISTTDFIKRLKECRTPSDAMSVIRDCEKEVEQHAANH